MPHFYFDTEAGGKSLTDVYGIDLPDKNKARQVAVETLPEMAQDNPSDADKQKVAVHVKDEAGEPVLDATLDIKVDWS